MLQPYLADLEERLDEAGEATLLAGWKRFWHAGLDHDVFVQSRPYRHAPRIEWPVIPINDAINAPDPDLMILRELKAVSDNLATGNGATLAIRSNYGTGILPSLFGTELFMMDRDLDTLPTARPLGADRAMRLLDAGRPEPYAGLGVPVLDMAERYRTLVGDYPKVASLVRQYHPDIQSPMDVLEVVYGSELFMAMYDDPGMVKALLRLITDTYSAFLRRWLAVVGTDSDIDLGDGQLYTAHWTFTMKGRLMLRCDSAMNFSPEMYREFILPFDSELLAQFGGGAMHFCGKGDHYIQPLCAVPDLYAINLSQPECNNMETIFKSTVDRGIRILGLPDSGYAAAKASGRPLRGMVWML
jgi:hypothetical protein